MASSPVASSEIFNVDDYGAMGDGEDDSEVGFFFFFFFVNGINEFELKVVEVEMLRI